MSAPSRSAGTDKRGPLGRARGTSSWVNEHFQVYANCKSTANCNLCFKDLQWNSSTSTLTDHLKNMHLPIFQAALTKKAEDADHAERVAAQLKANTQRDIRTLASRITGSKRIGNCTASLSELVST